MSEDERLPMEESVAIDPGDSYSDLLDMYTEAKCEYHKAMCELAALQQERKTSRMFLAFGVCAVGIGAALLACAAFMPDGAVKVGCVGAGVGSVLFILLHATIDLMFGGKSNAVEAPATDNKITRNKERRLRLQRVVEWWHRQPSNESLIQWAAESPPPQRWLDGDEEDLFVDPPNKETT